MKQGEGDITIFQSIIEGIKDGWNVRYTVDMYDNYCPDTDVISNPGFSWRNLSLNKPSLARYTAYGAIPRLGVRLYWDHMETMINGGAKMIYVAMCGEIDEGIAIFKVSDTPPNSDKAHFIDNDGMPSDHYL